MSVWRWCVSILVKQIQALAHHYVRQGSKAHRRLQVGRMIKFVEFIEQTERPHNLHEIGKRHVIAFWKAHRDLAPKTAHAYWLAFCVIWEWTDKPGQPPKPLFTTKPIADATDD
jgi:hypothetical protein